MLPSAERAAKMAVVVVPRFEPRVKGYILSTVMTPRPTRGVRVEVKIEEDCRRKVNSAPASIAT